VFDLDFLQNCKNPLQIAINFATIAIANCKKSFALHKTILYLTILQNLQNWGFANFSLRSKFSNPGSL